MELWQFLGDWHPKLVQFPLVLLLVGLLLDLAGVLWKSARARWAGLVVTGAGTLGLLFAFICGIYAEIWAGRAGISQHPIELHELAANIASWGFVVLFAWRILMAGGDENLSGKKRKWMGVYVAVGLGWYGLLALTGYLGGQLVFEYGAGVRGMVAGTLTMGDLNTLASRQTDENLRYSEWMHHVFGVMTIGLALSLMAQAVWPLREKSFRWIVPTFLVAGGLFLFFKADEDLYKLTDWRQWRDREVELHKSLAVIMFVIGAVGMWKGVVRGQWSVARKREEIGAEKSVSNSKLVAVLALIGGAMLFTHVHTVAPYANVAAGVYVAHVVMGLVALSIGAARLAQEFLPHWKKGLGVAFGGLMLVEAVLLVTYNEGLPWYIGYGKYERWGPGHSRSVTIAPFGDFRAAMFVDEAEGKLHVGFRDRFTDEPVVLTLDEMPVLLVTRGREEMAVPLENSVDAGVLKGSNFRAQAEFVKTAGFLSARLVLKVGGKERVGYFDPWVTPLIEAVPANEVAKYECPMHEGMRFKEEGKCPLCGMALVEIKPPRAAGELHDAKYEMKVEVKKDAEGERLELRVVDGAGKNVPLAKVHEQLMHIMIVSEDLGYFDHIHPVAAEVPGFGPLGFYALAYKFPGPGNYLMFADVTPVGDRGQVFRVPLVVDGEGVKVAKEEVRHGELVVDKAAGKMGVVVKAPGVPTDSAAWRLGDKAGEVQVEMMTQPRTMVAGLHTQLVFRLADGVGRPVTDLSPYLGAMGHCVVISEDTQEYLHSHPEQLRTPKEGEKGGPEVAFGVTFPTAGRYRVWGQFKEGERLVYGVFTVEVREGWLPAGLVRGLLGE